MQPPIFLSLDGYRVESILVQRSLRQRPRQTLRVTWHGYWIRDCVSLGEVAALVALETLDEE